MNDFGDNMTVRRRRSSGASRVLLVALAYAALIFCCAPIAALAGTQQAYKLAPGDRLTVTVVGQAELSGDFTVDSAGTINVPLLGPVQISGLTIVECQQRIVDGLASGLLNHPAVFIRIAEMRPIHILGDVKAPGGYPYRYGSLVKTAIAQAGGVGPTERAPGAVTEFLLADERVHVLGVTRDRLVIRKARLEAQLAGAKQFVAPVRLTVSTATAETVVAEERAAMEMQIDAFVKQLEALRSQKPQLLAENQAIEGQIASEQQQIDLVQSQIEQYSKLSEKGLGRSSSLVELKLVQAGKQSNVWRLEAERSRLRISIMDFDIKLQELEASTKRLTLTELQDVRQRLHEVEATLPSAREIRAARLQLAGGSLNAMPSYAITITRLLDSEPRIIDASETTPLEPGDIVEIRTLRTNAAVPRTAPNGAAAASTMVLQ